MSRRFLVVATLTALVPALLLAGCGSSDGAATVGKVSVADATADKPPLPSQAAVRFVIQNGTGTDDALVGVSSTAARSVSVHRSEDKDGVATMTPVDRLPLPAGSKVTFEPSGLHVMLEGIHRPLEVGDTFPLTLTFAKADPVTVQVTVTAPGADAHEGAHHG